MSTFKNIAIHSAAVLALTAAFAAPAFADPVLTNGSFTQASCTTGELGYNTTVTGWTNGTDGSGNIGYNFLFSPSTASTTGSAGQYGAVSLYSGSAVAGGSVLGASPDGGNFIGMDGAYHVAAISQTVTGLTVGQATTVSFYYAGAQQSGYTGTTTEALQVSLGNQTFLTPTLTDASHGFTGWQSESFTFTPTSTSEVLSFLAVGTPSGEPPFTLLDGVSVTSTPAVAATPEPSSLVLLGTGLLGVAGAARRRFLKS